MKNNLTTTNQNSKLILNKSRNLLDITNKLLAKRDIDTLVQSFKFKPFLLHKGHLSSVSSLTISPDGKYIVSGSSDKTIKIWDMKSGECLNTFEGHSDDVNSVTISPDGKYIVSENYDKTIRIWDIKSGTCLNTLEGHSSRVSSVTISPDGKHIVSGSWDKTIKIWDIKSGTCLNTLDNDSKISIDNNGYILSASNEAIEKYIRVSESPLTQRKLTKEEIQHFSKNKLTAQEIEHFKKKTFLEL